MCDRVWDRLIDRVWDRLIDGLIDRVWDLVLVFSFLFAVIWLLVASLADYTLF